MREASPVANGRDPRVAVIVPAYNRADLLPQALESVLAQTFARWKAVVVDDASSDGTYEVARTFAERDPERVEVIRLERNVGVGAARNAGIDASPESELICLLDSDDYLLEKYLERAVAVYDAAVAEGRPIGIVSSNARILTPDGFTGETWFDRDRRIPHVDIDAMIRLNYLHARAIFPRAAYEAAGGGFAPECGGSDDYDLWLRIMEAGYEAVTIDEPLVVYREHPGADSVDHLSRAEGKLVCFRRALERGALSARQRRAVRAQIRHFRALRARELAYQALRQRRLLSALLLGARAAPLGLMAFVQAPSRWPEWAREVSSLASSRRQQAP